MKPVERLAYSMAEAAESLGISRAHMYQLVQWGEVRTIKLGGNRRISRDELERLAREGTNT